MPWVQSPALEKKKNPSFFFFFLGTVMHFFDPRTGALGMLREADHEFEASLGYIVS
jgi:hypothetical protein